MVSPAAVNIAILAAGLLLYALIWYLTRGLPRFAKALARLLPLGLVLPAMLILSGQREAPAQGGGRPRLRQSAARRESAPSGGAPPPAEPKSSAAPPPAPAVPPPPVSQPAPRSLPNSATCAGPCRSSGIRKGGDALAQWSAARLAGGESRRLGRGARLFNGTDRVRKDEPKRVIYSSERARRLELGHALVTVPKTHQVPNIERPFAIRIPYFQVTLYEGAEDPKSHFTIKEMAILTREEFIARARERVTAVGSRAFKDQAVCSCTATTNSFDYALYRTAQMAYDSSSTVPPSCIAGRRSATFSGYGYDRESS
jgi:hypothetical protein